MKRAPIPRLPRVASRRPWAIIGFRALAPDGLKRSWRDVPRAEMPGLPAKAIVQGKEPVDAMAS